MGLGFQSGTHQNYKYYLRKVETDISAVESQALQTQEKGNYRWLHLMEGSRDQGWKVATESIWILTLLPCHSDLGEIA